MTIDFELHVFSCFECRVAPIDHDLDKGPFKYYVSKIVGGWAWPNAYVFLRG